MKYRYISILAVILMLGVAYFSQEYKAPINRYHQHLETQEKAACSDHAADQFCTHLPLISIETDAPIPAPFRYDADGNQLFNEYSVPIQNNEMVSATVQYFDSEQTNNHLTDTPVLSERAWIRVRGASSRAYDKKGYLLKFTEEDLINNKKVSLSGMTPDNSWALHGPFLDKTLIRNYLCYNLAGEIMEYAPNVRFCELFLNGTYQGLYLIVEKIGYNDAGRIQLSKTDPELTATSYIVQMDRGTVDPRRSLRTYGAITNTTTQEGVNYGQYEISYPSKTLTEAQRTFIERDISHFEKALTSFDYQDPKRGYRHYIDVDSFVNYFLINEFTLNYDAMGFSTYVYRDVRGKMKLCVWDFNSAFDNYTYPNLEHQNFLLQQQVWYPYLFKDPHFVDRVVKRYHHLRKTCLNEDYLMQYIDDTIAYLGPAVERNFEVWGYTFQPEHNGVSCDLLTPAERNPRSYAQAVQQLKDCISKRLAYMDESIDQLYALCHESINKQFNHGPGGR